MKKSNGIFPVKLAKHIASGETHIILPQTKDDDRVSTVTNNLLESIQDTHSWLGTTEQFNKEFRLL